MGNSNLSFNQQGAAHVVYSSGLDVLFSDRQREIASALQHNIDTIDAVLAGKTNSPKPVGRDEQASLVSIEAQLKRIADQQRIAIDIADQTADNQSLDQIFNAPFGGGDSDLGVGAAPPTGSNMFEG